MSAQLEQHEVEQLRNVMHKMADFIALYEAAEEKLRAREKALEARINASDRMIHEQLMSIKSVIGEFQSIMTEAGAARWRVAAETAMKEGEDHLKAIQDASKEFLAYTKESCQRLDRATSFTIKGVSKAINSFTINDFRSVTEQNCEQISQTCNSSLSKMTDIVKWFHWKNIGMALSLTLVVTMITGLYLNDEWPWEAHNKVVQERQLAEAVTQAWPTLNSHDKQEILHSFPKSGVV